jgi:hypothetical protein
MFAWSFGPETKQTRTVEAFVFSRAENDTTFTGPRIS